MKEHGLDLQLILREMMATWQLGELVGEGNAAVRVLWRDEVEGDLDAGRQVAHLRRGCGGGVRMVATARGEASKGAVARRLRVRWREDEWSSGMQASKQHSLVVRRVERAAV